jgi:hypothetical protein
MAGSARQELRLAGPGAGDDELGAVDVGDGLIPARRIDMELAHDRNVPVGCDRWLASLAAIGDRRSAMGRTRRS